MTPVLNRRRFLLVSAAAAALPGAPRAATPDHVWKGIALGAPARMTLSGLDPRAARETERAVEAELARLEEIFSLYRADSALMRLNRTGRLDGPPPEMLELLTLAAAVHASTAGAFDPTVQPLWRAYAEAGGRPDAATLSGARALIGWPQARLDAAAVVLERPGMALTLNGIAQGYVTDRIAALLRARGLHDVLIDMGEVAGLGRRPDGGPWRAGVASPGGQVVRRVALSDRALATSAPLGTVLDEAGQVGHILDPRTGAPAAARALVSVSGQSAALADALSTAFCAMDDAGIAAALAAHPSARLEALA